MNWKCQYCKQQVECLGPLPDFKCWEPVCGALTDEAPSTEAMQFFNRALCKPKEDED